MSVEKQQVYLLSVFCVFLWEEFHFTITLPPTPHTLQSLPPPPQKEMLLKTKCIVIVLILFIRFGKSGSKSFI